ncbi:hypothetical protein PMI29_05323, partial [Pseudomonas sp. GM49]
MCRPHRGQARSHKGYLSASKFVVDINPCGSGLAREEAS